MKRARLVSVCLQRGSLADAAVESLRSTGRPLAVDDRGPYLHISCDEELAFDLTEMGARVGREVPLAEFLSIFATFAGRVRLTDSGLSIHAEMLGLVKPPGP
jgi:hypothetical protein